MLQENKAGPCPDEENGQINQGAVSDKKFQKLPQKLQKNLKQF